MGKFAASGKIYHSAPQMMRNRERERESAKQSCVISFCVVTSVK